MKELSGIKVMIKRSFAYIILSRASRHLLAASAITTCSLLSLHAGAQDMFTEDTVNIPAVTVRAAASLRHTPYTVVKIDSAVMARYEGGDLGTLLQSASLLSVKRYGNSGLASVSIRGLPGSHTAVTWNGLPVNSPGNGYGDFTILPVTAATSVKVTAGGSDLDDIAGSIGGEVELFTLPVFDAVTEGSLSFSAGSYGNWSSAAKLRSGSSTLSAKISLWGGKARNDFRFINVNAPTGAEEGRRANAGSSSEGATADLGLLLGNSLLAAHVWYNNSDRELPGPVTTVQQDFGERQKDRSLKGVVNYSMDHGSLAAEVIAGGSHDINLYYNEAPGLNGENSSGIYMIRTRISYRLNDRFELLLNAGDEHQRAQSLSFQNPVNRNIFSASLGAKYNVVPRLRLMLQARQMAVTGTRVSPEFTAGATWILPGAGDHVIKTSLSRNIKLPCLNDLYWMPGGNIELQPERATGGEASWSFSSMTAPGPRTTLDMTLYASRVDNLIQWLPGESGLWSAENVRSVNVTGAEARAGRELTVSEWKIKGYVNYGLTRSVIAGSEIPNDRSEGSQLVYTPLHHLNVNIDAGWRIFSGGITAVAESRRYTTSDNSEWLPASFLADMYLGTSVRAGVTAIRADLRISNILNTGSECVRNYPMPLRTFNLRLTLTLSDKPVIHETTP
jgi:iron complex outermembrane receptor protein